MTADHSSQPAPTTRARLAALAAFAVAGVLAAAAIAWLETRQLEQEKTQMGEQISNLAHEVEDQVERALSATYALAALVRQGNGTVKDFDEVAGAMLPYYPGADSLQLAPGGVVTSVVPLAGNEKAIGHNLLLDRQRTKEAFLARDSGELTLAGPFALIQGGMGVVGRLPVFLDTAGEKRKFWGFASVLIRFPGAVDKTHLNELVGRGIDYELARIHPDTLDKQIIAASTATAMVDPVSRPLYMPNGVWFLSAAPRDGWADPTRLGIKIAIGLLFSLMAARLAYQMSELRRHRAGLQVLVDRRTAELEARQLELNRAQAVARTGSWVYDAQLDQLSGSPETGRILGLDDDVPLDYPAFKSRLHPEDGRLLRDAWREAVDRAAFDLEFRLIVGGEVRWVHAQAEITIDLQGRLVRAIGTLRDITERREDETRMREAMVVFNASSQAIVITDAAGVITSVNPACSSITGYSADEMVGQRPAMFRSGRHDAAFYRQMWDTLTSTGHWEGEIWNRRKGGPVYLQWITISAVRDANDRPVKYVAHASDITHRKQREEVIWRQANFDELTGLANRHLLHDRLAHALAQARRSGRQVGVMILDLDGFKWINDTLGHDVGDRLLVEVARRLIACSRDQDTVARMGGDEFTLVVDELGDSGDLRLVGEKVLRALAEPFVLGGQTHHMSGSLGLTLFPDDGQDVQTLFRNADIAMYEAKQLGKNRCEFYAQHMRDRAHRRVELESELHTALERGEFELHYQPIVDAGRGVMTGAEALLRWRHPARGLIGPVEFIGVAEETGLIVPIGQWVLREAARQVDQWRRQGHPSLRLAVNVSGVQFREEGLAALLQQVRAEFNLGRSQLMLEITESVLMHGSDLAEARMREIRANGVSYALDDFGTGYSSLSYLKRFPVDVVKIDRSFIADCASGGSDARLVEAIIRMAHSLDLSVTAEGVETADQVEFLRRHGCDQLQGYIISTPLAAAAFERLFERRDLLAAQVSPLTTGERNG